MLTEDNVNLILGAAGFIGTNLTKQLVKNGAKVRCFDRPEAEMGHLGIEPDCIFRGNLKDFADPESVGSLMENVGCVYHLISTTCPTNSNQDIAGEFEDNVISTIRLLDVCVKYRIPRIVFLSSGGTVYGKDHNGMLSEDIEAFPISSYGIQKLTIEKILYLYHEIHGLDYRVIRLANPYGPYQKPNGIQGAVAAFTWKAVNKEPVNIYGDGTVVRDYIYIDDAIKGILNIASDRASHRLYNLGSGQGTSINELIDKIQTGLDCRLDIRHTPGRQVDVPVNVLDISRYESDFGKPDLIPLEEGIKKLALFYEENK